MKPRYSGRRMCRPPARHVEVVGQHDLRARRVDVHRRGALDDVGDALHRHPAAGIAAHGEAVQAEVDVFLDRGGREHRNADGLPDEVGLRGLGRGLRAVIVARQREHAAVRRGARGVGMTEDVAAAVDARTLAVPDAEHAVVARALEEIDLLRAPDRGGREILVHARREVDVVRVQMRFRLGELLVVRAQRRAAIAGDVSGRVQARELVAAPLQHRQAHQRLGAGEEHAAVVEGVLVVERDGGECGGRIHGRAAPGGWGMCGFHAGPRRGGGAGIGWYAPS